MSKTRLHTFGSRFLTTALLLWLAGAASLFAQTTAPESSRSAAQRSALTITAAASGERIRITAPASVVQMHVEVYAASGEKVSDVEIRGGNVFDWQLQDGQAERLATGAYVCVVTAKTVSGKLTQKIGAVRVEANSVSIQPADSQQLSAQQAQAIGPVEENSSWTIPGKDEQTTTVIAHDGADGQLTRGRGALSFRIGDFFSGNDEEQMRLTEEGNLGIGTAEPKAKLDVAGMIRAGEGLLFSDGSKLNVNDKGALTLTNSNGNVVPNAAGSGTQDRIAKWTDNAGTLGDALISESNGNVVVGNAAQTGKIQIFGTAVQDVFAGMGPDVTNGPAFNYGYAGSSFGRSAGFFNVRPDAAAVAPNPSLRFMTANVQRMIITNTGNVGIGTTSPGAKLHVNGVEEGIRIQGPAAGASNLAYATFHDAAGTRTGYVGDGSTGDNHVFLNADIGDIVLNTSAGRILTVTSTGNVGIGTTSPQARLDVRGNVKLGDTGQLFAPGGQENLGIIRGVISAGGSIIVGSGFQVSHPGTGDYLITFDIPFAGPPAVTATGEFAPVVIAMTNGVTSGSAMIRVVTLDAQTSNVSFHFIAIGPR